MTLRVTWTSRLAAALALLLIANACTAGEVTHLRYDFAAATLKVSTGDGEQSFALADSLEERLAGFRTGLARGEWSREEAVALGQELLGPASSVLATADRWEVTPLEAAPLAALVAPWETSQPLVHHVVLWYRPREFAPAGVPLEPAGVRRPDGVLAVMPFLTADFHVDSGDTLLAAFRAGSHTVDLIPRNDTTDASVAGAFEEHRYSLVWVRADPERIEPLLGPLNAGPAVLWWTRPATSADTAGAGEVFGIASRWTTETRTLMVDLWPRPESVSAAGVAPWIDAISRGEDVATATAEARRRLADAGETGVAAWAGWIVIGEGTRPVAWHGLNWLQRWLR